MIAKQGGVGKKKEKNSTLTSLFQKKTSTSKK